MKNGTVTASKFMLLGSMLIFGSIGIFAKFTSLPSDIVAISRGFIGAAFLAAVKLITDKKLSFKIKRRDLLILLLSGGFLGINWILLFESYKYTSVAVATLCYYLAPVFVLIAAPFLLKERLDAKKIFCLLVSLVGMAFVSNLLGGSLPSFSEARGILFGTGAAVLYAALIIANKKISHIPSFEKTLSQLLFSGVILIPYAVFSGSFKEVTFEPKDILLISIMGIIHTGLAYLLYFSSIKLLDVQTVALWGYIDPLSAIIFSSIILPAEKLGSNGIIGAVLILGSAILCEIKFKKPTK
ncbi:MAG: DMT family transporter [Oscillospiraceae bacterium]|nr:DMT family transporter [Oscillospiraceae bacterium]